VTCPLVGIPNPSCGSWSPFPSSCISLFLIPAVSSLLVFHPYTRSAASFPFLGSGLLGGDFPSAYPSGLLKPLDFFSFSRGLHFFPLAPPAWSFLTFSVVLSDDLSRKIFRVAWYIFSKMVPISHGFYWLLTPPRHLRVEVPPPKSVVVLCLPCYESCRSFSVFLPGLW